MRYIIREVYYLLISLYKRMKCKKLQLGFRAKVDKSAKFEGYNKVEHHAYFSGEMGFASYIGEYTHFNGKLGRYCSVGGRVMVLSLTHPVRKFVSTSPCFYSTRKQSGVSFVEEQRFNETLLVKGTEYPVIVGNDVYIGYGATIIAPVIIGDGAIVAAGAVVTKNVAPYTIVAGNPAKVIRKRFADNEIEVLQSVKWWDKDFEWVKKHIELFDDVDKFTLNVLNLE